MLIQSMPVPFDFNLFVTINENYRRPFKRNDVITKTVSP